MNIYLLWRTTYGMQELEGVYLSRSRAKQVARSTAAHCYEELRASFPDLPPPVEEEKLQIYFSGHFRRSIFEIRVTNEDVLTVGEHPVDDSPLEALASQLD